MMLGRPLQSSIDAIFRRLDSEGAVLDQDIEVRLIPLVELLGELQQRVEVIVKPEARLASSRAGILGAEVAFHVEAIHRVVGEFEGQRRVIR